jgi:hypothetical protein
MKGTSFEMKPLRTIEIGDMEVSEETPTLMIKEKSEITPLIRKATIEEVPDKEAPILVANQQPISDIIIEEIPPLSNDSEDFDEELLKAVILELEEDGMIIAYIQEEPVIGIFEKKEHLIYWRTWLSEVRL